MPEIKITIDDKKAQKDLLALSLKIPQLAMMPLHRSAQWIAGQSQKNYLRGPRPKRLGVITGRLRTSISARTSIVGKEIVAHIGTNIKSTKGFNYPGHWENTAMQPRPFLKPARDDNRDKWLRIFEKGFKANLIKWAQARAGK